MVSEKVRNIYMAFFINNSITGYFETKLIIGYGSKPDFPLTPETSKGNP